MPRKKKEMGRPMERQYPPRIDATPEEIAHVVLNAGRPKGPVSGKLYFCQDCKRQVAYPETLYRDGRCEDCHKAANRRESTCFCGIEISKADRLCTERDCPYKR